MSPAVSAWTSRILWVKLLQRVNQESSDEPAQTNCKVSSSDNRLVVPVTPLRVCGLLLPVAGAVKTEVKKEMKTEVRTEVVENDAVQQVTAAMLHMCSRKWAFFSQNGGETRAYKRSKCTR